MDWIEHFFKDMYDINVMILFFDFCLYSGVYRFKSLKE